MNKLDLFIHEDDRLKNRVVKTLNWSDEETENALKAYKEFLELKISLQDWNATILLPPLQVKKVWELHVLDTSRYVHSCNDLFGDIIHFDPDGESNPTKRKERIDKTKLLYQARFSMEPTGILWQFEQPYITANNLCHGERKGGKKRLFIREQSGKVITIDIKLTATVENLKGAYQDKTGVPVNETRFIFAGGRLEDGRRLIDCNIENESTIHCVLRQRGC